MLSRFIIGEWEVDSQRKAVRKDGDWERIRPNEMAVLCYLAEKEDGFATRTEIMSHVWRGLGTTDHALTKAISHLRKVLGADYIFTHHKAYRLAFEPRTMEIGSSNKAGTSDPDGDSSPLSTIEKEVKVRGVIHQNRLVGTTIWNEIKSSTPKDLGPEVALFPSSGTSLLMVPMLAVNSLAARGEVSVRTACSSLQITEAVLFECVELSPFVEIRNDHLVLCERVIETVILDWSNTLVDEIALDDRVCEAIGELTDREGFRRLLDHLENRSDPRWYDYFFLAEELGLSRDEVTRIHLDLKAYISWLPGARALLDGLLRSRSKVVLCTNCAREVLEIRSQLLNLSLNSFDGIYTSDMLPDSKSKEVLLVEAYKNCSGSKQGTWVLSDSYERDILPAKEIGLNTIWMYRPFQRSYWGTPAMPVDTDDFYLRRSNSPSPFPDFVALSHAETMRLLVF